MARTRLAAGGILAAMTISMAACGGGTATTGPTAGGPGATVPAATLPGSSGAGSVPGAVDPGTIVTAEMAASIIGGSPTKLTIPGVGGQGMSVAAYTTTSGDTVTILVEQVPGGVANAQLQAAIVAAGAQGTLVSISGLGDAAGKAVTANEATIAFVKGSNLVVIAAGSSSLTGDALEPKVEAVAQQVAGAL
ncbi:MAG TPA: hypothetical protein VGJ17_08630 [Candidatus Limnocylindrales bacterium]|jgi:hypothetical protein